MRDRYDVRYCKSGQIGTGLDENYSDIYFCVRGKVSDKGAGLDAAFDTQEPCFFKDYKYQDPEEYDEGNTTSKCGYNKDAKYYCPVHKGDPIYQEYW